MFVYKKSLYIKAVTLQSRIINYIMISDRHARDSKVRKVTRKVTRGLVIVLELIAISMENKCKRKRQN